MRRSFLLYALTLLLLLCNQTINSQNDVAKISVTISNIPKIDQKVEKKIGGTFTTWITDKSPTISYTLPGEAEKHPIPLKAHQTKVFQTFDEDLIYLTLRYNPGISKLFMLRRGDLAFIEYANGKPYIDVQNRALKEYDEDIDAFIETLEPPIAPMNFYYKNRRGRKTSEKKKAAEKLMAIITSLDSLVRNDLLSTIEHSYYRKKMIYERELYLEKFTLPYLQAPDLHVEGFDLFMRQYVFGNLKKKIISLGNGMARNSLESFDFTYASEDFSPKNKKHLLTKYLKGIKKDFSSTTYKNRYTKYQSLYGKNAKTNTQKASDLNFSDIYKLSADVTLTDAQNNPITLKNLLDSNKGKVVYIDFWASWCAPCRKAFPAYKKIKEAYKNEDITFVFISGDKDEGRWKKAEIEEQLSNSYLATNHPDAKFYEDLHLKSFPRYLIFDKNGKLVRDRAPGPNSDTIKDMLDELLK